MRVSGILFGISMKYFLLILSFIFITQEVYSKEEPSYCDGGSDDKECEWKRAQYFFGDKAGEIDKQVESLSELVREAMLSRKYEPLEHHIEFPFTFVVTDFRKAELRKDATGYTLKVNNMREFKNFLLKINKRHPKVFLEFLPERQYSTHYMNGFAIYLINANNTFVIHAIKNHSIKLVRLAIEIF